jgi:hypothetical protein
MRQALVLSMTVLACGPPMRTPTPGISVAADFEGYETWASFELAPVDGVVSDGGVHDVGFRRRVFINQLPSGRERPFPIGTLIVKEEPFDTLAMAKRGGTYNTKGALGWEWLELKRTSTGALGIKWRGLGPPVGEEYKSSDATCNDCHRSRPENDSVLTPALQ